MAKTPTWMRAFALPVRSLTATAPLPLPLPLNATDAVWVTSTADDLAATRRFAAATLLNLTIARGAMRAEGAAATTREVLMAEACILTSRLSASGAEIEQRAQIRRQATPYVASNHESRCNRDHA